MSSTVPFIGGASLSLRHLARGLRVAGLAGALRRVLASPSRRREAPLLAELAPEFAAELAGLLYARGDPWLARTVANLSVAELCPCNDPACASFYAIPRFVASWRWPGRGTTLDLGATEGTIRIDAAEGEIISVEVLDRPELAAMLEAALGSSCRVAGRRRHPDE